MSAWRAALRMARREARRAKGRSALVLAMIALPVLALGFAAVSYDMLRLSPAEELDRRLGAADARLTWQDRGAVVQDPQGQGYANRTESIEFRQATPAELLAQLPAGSRVVPVGDGWLQLRTATGIGGITAWGIDVADPIAAGMVTLLAGRAPATAGEMAVTENALRRLGTALGGTVTLADKSRSFLVVGLVEFPDDLSELVVVRTEALPDPGSAWLVDTPEPIGWGQVKQLNQHGIVVVSRAVILDPPPASEVEYDSGTPADYEAIGFGVLIGGLGLLEVVLLAGPAFAVGARRRHRDLALVAANGGTAAHLRRIVLADGVVLGLAGAAIGLTAAVPAAFAARPLVEEYLANQRAGGHRVFPAALAAIALLAVLTGVLAALVPAFVAARQHVVAALTGRRGAVRSRKRWLLTGLIMTGAGTAVAALGARSMNTTVILTGLVIGELGLVLCTPSVVGLIARAGRLLPLAPRIALRDTARNRAAAAPAISAVMAAVAGSVALGTFLVSSDMRDQAAYNATLPTGYVGLFYADVNAPEENPTAEQVLTAARASFLVTDHVTIREPACPAGTGEDAICVIAPRLPAERACPYERLDRPIIDADQKAAARDPRCRTPAIEISGPVFSVVVDDDGSAVAMLTGAAPDDVARAADVLKSGGMVVTDERYVTDGTVTIWIHSDNSPTFTNDATRTVPGYVLTTGVSVPTTFVSTGVLTAVGFGTGPAGFVLATDVVPDRAAQDRLAATLAELPGRLIPYVERGAPRSGDPILIVLAGVAGVITLGAAGIATGLAAADGRSDLSTLAAVGASPRTRRVLSLSQSGVIAGLGSLLGIAAGLGAALAVMVTLNRAYADIWPVVAPYPVTVPWTVLGVLVLVPLVAMLGTGLLTRSRLPIERRLG